MILGRHHLTRSTPLPSFLAQESLRAPQVRVPAGEHRPPKPTQTQLSEGSPTKGLFTKAWTALQKSTKSVQSPELSHWGGAAFPEGIQGVDGYPNLEKQEDRAVANVDVCTCLSVMGHINKGKVGEGEHNI